MTKFIINADDFGLTKGINKGIIKAHEIGIVTSTTVMMNMDYAHEALNYAKLYPKLTFGVHLNLTQGYPISNGVQSLTTEKGEFKEYKDFISSDFSVDEVYKEFKAQIEAFLKMGLYPSHFDSHHHVHSIKKLEDVCLALQKEYQIPFRNRFSYKNDIYTISDFNEGFYDHHVNESFFNQSLLAYDIVEIMCHPGTVDQELIDISTYNEKRQVELAILTSEKIRDYIIANQIDLINYKKEVKEVGEFLWN